MRIVRAYYMGHKKILINAYIYIYILIIKYIINKGRVVQMRSKVLISVLFSKCL